MVRNVKTDAGEMVKVLDWHQYLPEVADISDEVSAVFDDNAHPVRFVAGERLFGPRQLADGLILPVSGTIRVQHRSQTGHVTTRYRVRAGETCTLTTACHLSFENRALEGIAETDTKVIKLPRDAFDELVKVSREFRAFVFDACTKRIADLCVVIEETLASDIESLLAAKLVELCKPACDDLNSRRLSIELGATPVVVSHHLSEFERRGWIARGRGRIELKDQAVIEALTRMPQYRQERRPEQNSIPNLNAIYGGFP